MILGKVVGTVVSTQKDENLEGLKLLVVQQVDLDLQRQTGFVVAADAVGAGMGELVIVVQGSSARMATRVKGRPLDASIIGIIDSIEYEGNLIFQKGA
jgi:microcompartment protein CcmK/EutM